MRFYCYFCQRCDIYEENTYHIMKQVVKLTESDIHNIVRHVVNEALNEHGIGLVGMHQAAADNLKNRHRLGQRFRRQPNGRIQNNKEYYALLRMGEYSFFEDFVVIRDNSKFVSCHVGKIKTHWNTFVTQIFYGHVSYIS